MQKKKKTEEKTSWGKVAFWYDGLLAGEDTYQQKVILPKLLALMHIKVGERVLDLACGQGFFTAHMAEAGADVTGADISAELIERAKKNSPKGKFIVSPADKLSALGDAGFDAVSIVLALQNISNLSGTIAECFRVLKPGGKLYIVLNHPTFRVPGKSSWEYDEKKKIQYRRIEQYLSERMTKIDMNPGEKNPAYKQYTASFHRPLEVYFTSLQKSGFLVSHLEEWVSHKNSQAGPRQKAEDLARKEIPLFMAIEAVKK